MKDRLEYLDWLGSEFVSMKKIEEDSFASEVLQLQKKDGSLQILKIYFDPSRWRRERYFLEILNGKLPVAEKIDELEPTEERHGAILMNCLKGESLKAGKLTEEIAFEMGSFLARLHNFRVMRYGDLSVPGGECNPKEELRQYFERSLEESRGVLPKDFIEKCKNYFQNHLPELGLLDGPCLIHHDYKPEKIMVHEGKIQGILDWEMSRGGFAQEDFAHMEHLVWTKDDRTKQPFLDGYAKIRLLPSMQGSLPILRFCKALHVIGLTVKSGTWQKTQRDLFNANAAFLTSQVESSESW